MICATPFLGPFLSNPVGLTLPTIPVRSDACESYAYDAFLLRGQGKASKASAVGDKAADAGYKAMMKNFDKC